MPKQKIINLWLLLLFLANPYLSEVHCQIKECYNAVVLDFSTSALEKNSLTAIFTEEVVTILNSRNCRLIELEGKAEILGEQTELAMTADYLHKIKPALERLSVEKIIMGTLEESDNGDLKVFLKFYGIATGELIHFTEIVIPEKALANPLSRYSVLDSEINLILMGFQDPDGDGVPGDADQCPDTPGPLESNGCPDSDKDGISDQADPCPDTKGPSETFGCPDSDGDGVADKDDKCPNQYGLIHFQGCPPVVEAWERADREAWRYTIRENTIAAYQRFLEEFPNSKYAEEARKRIERLKKLESGKDVQIWETGKYPTFPFPPPQPSARELVALNQFENPSDLDQVYKELLDILDTCGYYEKSVYEIPNGFALVTRIEKINRDASSKASPERWEMNSNEEKKFSIAEYIKSLFSSNPGFYRVLVFMVTDVPFTTTNALPSKEQAADWLDDGLNVLPDEIGATTVNANYSCTALIYEFKFPESGASPFLLSPSTHTGREHLIKANLWNFFSGKD